MKAHPSDEVLALYSAADLPWLESWRIGQHAARCEPCEQQVSIYRAARVELRRQAKNETLTGFEAIADWSRLEREMEGNIVVGLAAARAIQKRNRSNRWLVNAALAAGIAILFVLGWITHIPADQTSRIFSLVQNAFSANRTREVAGPVLRSVPDGILVGSPEGSLTILHPASALVSISGKSAVEAQYVDDDTGQVTITKVYGQ